MPWVLLLLFCPGVATIHSIITTCCYTSEPAELSCHHPCTVPYVHSDGMRWHDHDNSPTTTLQCRPTVEESLPLLIRHWQWSSPGWSQSRASPNAWCSRAVRAPCPPPRCVRLRTSSHCGHLPWWVETSKHVPTISDLKHQKVSSTHGSSPGPPLKGYGWLPTAPAQQPEHQKVSSTNTETSGMNSLTTFHETCCPTGWLHTMDQPSLIMNWPYQPYQP